MKQVKLFLGDEAHRLFKSEAAARGKSMSDLLREFVMKIIAPEDRKEVD